jgi:phage terminase large subunit
MSKINIIVPKKYLTLTQEARYHVFYGGRGSAKSHSIARFLVAKALSKQTKILCTRELQNSIADSVHKLLSDVIRNHNLEQWFEIGKAEISCVNGSSFIFKGLAHNIDSVKSTEGVDICWIEEADKVSQQSWDILVPTIRKPNSSIIISFNPTYSDDPVYKIFVANPPPPESIVNEVSWRDNPHFPEILEKEMLHMKATDYEKYMHIWEGQIRTVSDAQIFKNKFVVKEFDSTGHEAFFYGMDFGFSQDPSTVIRSFIKNRCLYIDDEAYGHHIEMHELHKLIDKVLLHRYAPIKADSARPETISYLANAPFSYNIEAAKKWSGSVEDGIEFLKSFEQIIIHPRCVKTLEEFQKYSFKVDPKTGMILPIILDTYNHCVDSIRYSMDSLIKRKTTIYDQGVW